MTRVLLVTSSILGEHGQSNDLARQFERQVRQRSDIQLTHRDVVADDLPHLTLPELSSWQVAPEERSEQQRELALRSDERLDELLAHDVVVLAVPMYNLGMPSQLKAWFDRILRAGKSFKYTENGPVGLIEGKRAILLGARGGQYAGSELDTQTPHIRHLLGLIGISEFEAVYAEGLNMGDEIKEAALTQAHAEIAALVEAL
ncbi:MULTISPECIES: FMN-dependent NADH-azoreductase [Halomonas]|uniref:FMN-dependent NADH-azoreductase n=1 Tax=Halomonas TaxID=2745 RepID=UPI001C9473E0|nr:MULTISPECIES: NAD(P)H-dependent oxidoreductase [Halomonas]MBY5924822.1 NAD(P)H-dependent oxidoreductase [Halomonas sp. DP4Y7-2]MBY6207392.1 NAD(P)H-dependent oxidoreductase [Halomonas sp. DP3Y7-2]MBY6228201.1 NAD(P)H-dependent oxidoreductase [Halomonas sp. DP3Y7-1]MBY6231864.1 NAD(P)H-dependent oxidoreductase [Halomonas sp. DP4Y7-1]MCA0916267.1 NAD(P)H-dependent oxidoreductase [Halomonas denitrificans]